MRCTRFRIRYRTFAKNYNRSLSEYHWDELKVASDSQKTEIEGPLIVAVPHASLCDLLSADMVNRSPHLGEIAKLQSVPMASVHLHLKDKFTRRLRSAGTTLPREPVALVDSDFKLSFVANSRLRPHSPEPYLNIVASDSASANSLSAPEEFTYDRGSRKSGARLSIHNPVTMLDHILHEFRKFVHFEEDEIDKELLQIDRNVGRELFINEIGSWKWRPHTRTKIKDLFRPATTARMRSTWSAWKARSSAASRLRNVLAVVPPRLSYKDRKAKTLSLLDVLGLEFHAGPYAAGAWAWSAYHDLARRLDPTR